MSLRRFATPLALLSLLLLFPQMTARFAFAWFCEGRVCGVTMGRCCCDNSIAGQRDKRCGITLWAGRTQTASDRPAVCAAGCNCKMVFEVVGGQMAVASDAADKTVVFPPLAVLPAVRLVPVAYLITLRLVRPIEARGPPVPSHLVSFCSLRAPPHA